MLLLKPRWLNLQLTVQSTCTFNIPIVVLTLQRMKIRGEPITITELETCFPRWIEGDDSALL